jgi:hypothetical protein
MAIARVDNQTGRLGPGGLPASVGPGGIFDIGSAWRGPTTPLGDKSKIICGPPLLGTPSSLYEVVYATLVNGSSTATVVQRNAEAGSGLFDHPARSLWTCTSTAADLDDVIHTTFVWNQGTPAATWHIIHNLGRQPSVELVDSSGDEIEADLVYVNTSQIDAIFIAATAGFAYLN